MSDHKRIFDEPDCRFEIYDGRAAGGDFDPDYLVTFAGTLRDAKEISRGMQYVVWDADKGRIVWAPEFGIRE